MKISITISVVDVIACAYNKLDTNLNTRVPIDAKTTVIIHGSDGTFETHTDPQDEVATVILEFE